MTAKVISFWKWLAAKLWPSAYSYTDTSNECVVLTVTDSSVQTHGATALAPTSEPRLVVDSQLTTESPVWHFRSTILDRLDEYFVCMRSVRTHDPDAYDLFSRIGLAVPADRFYNPEHSEAQVRIKILPKVTFGGVLCPFDDDEKDDHVYPSFIYFTKLNHPSRVQSCRGEVYRLTVVYDDSRKPSVRWKSRLCLPMRCHIGIESDGSMSVLREPVVSVSQVQPSRRRKGCRKPPAVSMRVVKWQIPEWLSDVKSDRVEDPERWAIGLLVMALLTYTESISRFIIRAKRNGCVASFGIDLKRGKYFFADRDATELAVDGKRKRIFHSVSAHERVINENLVTQVRHHYRGLRDFTWCGSQIHIVLPQHTGVLGFDKSAFDAADMEDTEKPLFINSGDTGDKLAEVLDS